MIHLHVHTEYSIRDSIVTIPKLVDNSSGAIAITDHGNLGGWIELILECEKKKIKPILGVEAYCVKNLYTKDAYEKQSHIILLAINKVGYQNLIILNNIAHLEGFYYHPRIDMNTLLQYCDGLIALTGCISSIVYFWDIWYLAEKMPVYIEIMGINTEEQKRHNLHILNEYKGLPVVITNDVHYLKKEDEELHKIMITLQDREAYIAGHLCNEEEVYKTFLENHQYVSREVIDEGIKNTYNIADIIEPYDVVFGNFILPKFVKE